MNDALKLVAVLSGFLLLIFGIGAFDDAYGAPIVRAEIYSAGAAIDPRLSEKHLASVGCQTREALDRVAQNIREGRVRIDDHPLCWLSDNFVEPQIAVDSEDCRAEISEPMIDFEGDEFVTMTCTTDGSGGLFYRWPFTSTSVSKEPGIDA